MCCPCRINQSSLSICKGLKKQSMNIERERRGIEMNGAGKLESNKKI